MHHDVRQTWTKQFIYIQRLDNTLTRASDILPYPKSATEFPICTKVKIYKEDNEFLNNYIAPARSYCEWYYEKETVLFQSYKDRTSVRPRVAIYDETGSIVTTAKNSVEAAEYGGISATTICRVLKNGKIANGYYYRNYDPHTEPAETIEFDYICEIDGLKFIKQIDIAEYCGVTKQAVSGSVQRKSKQINGYNITWRN